MKILHLDSGYDWRGGQQQVACLVRGLEQARVEQHLVVRHSAIVETRMRSLAVPLSTLPFKSEFDVLSILKLAGIIRHFKPDIVHAHDSRTLGQAAVLRALGLFPHLVGARRVPFPIRGNPLWKWKYQRLPDKIVVVSHFIEDVLHASGVSPDKTMVVYDGLEIPPPPRPDDRKMARRRLRLGDDEWVVGSVGRFTSEKGHEVLLRGFQLIAQNIQEARLVLVGDGPLKPHYQKLTGELGLSERVLLFDDWSDLADIVPAFDLFVLPSLQEGLGSILLLAMALQVPVCASQTGGIPELVTDKVSGFLIRPGDVHHLASVIQDAKWAPDLCRECAANAYDKVLSQFSVDRMVAGTLEVYANVLRS